MSAQFGGRYILKDVHRNDKENTTTPLTILASDLGKGLMLAVISYLI